jgi:hypothetical protein
MLRFSCIGVGTSCNASFQSTRVDDHTLRMTKSPIRIEFEACKVVGPNK